MRRQPPRGAAAALSTALMLAQPAAAGGLDTLLDAAVAHDPSIASAVASTDQAAADATVARAALLPSLTATGGYTRNQYAAEVALPGQADPIVITPIDQLDAALRLDVPLWDGSAWASTRAATRCRDASEARADATVAQALFAVAQAAWDARTAQANLTASEAAVAANEALADKARAMQTSGTATTLDVLRVTADLEQSREQLSLARADAAAARRQLASRTGTDRIPDDLAPRRQGEAGLAVREVAELTAARANERCLSAQSSQQKWAYAPRISSFAQERLSNATGFIGQPASYSLGVQGSWTLFDGGAREGKIASANAALRGQQADLDAAARDAEVALANARDDADAAAAGLSSATARRAATAEALRVSQERFDAGLALTSDVAQAIRDDRDAAVSLAKAEAREALALESLRIASGQPLLERSP